jgi:muconate cycloisomerase
MVSDGNRIYKVKTGVKSHREDLAHLEAIRSEFGDAVDLRLDYNQALEPFGALKILRDVESFSPTFIEQPVRRDHLAAMASFVAALDTPILADESCFDSRDLMEIIHLKAADAISIKLMKTGGLFKAQAIQAIADTAGIPGYGGTLWEGGVALAAGTQLIAATPVYMPHHVLTEDVLEEKVVNQAGHVVVPDGPGLGIRISEQSVRANGRVLAER